MAEASDRNLGWQQSKLQWEESFRKMNELAEQLTVSLGQTVEELKQLREEREALESEVVEDPLVPSQPDFSKEPGEMPNACLENAVPSQENTVDALFSDSKQESNNPSISLHMIEAELIRVPNESGLDSLMKNAKALPPEHSSMATLLNLKSKLGAILPKARGSSSDEFMGDLGENDYSKRYVFKGGADFLLKLEFPIFLNNYLQYRSRWDPGVKIGSKQLADVVTIGIHHEFSEKVADSGKFSVSFLESPGAYQMFDEMLTITWTSFVQLNHVHILRENWIFDPGDFIDPRLAKRDLEHLTFSMEEVVVEQKYSYPSRVMANRVIMPYDREKEYFLGSDIERLVDLLGVMRDLLRSTDATSSFVFDPGGVEKLCAESLFAVFLTNCCWASGGLILVFDPGGSRWSWRKEFGASKCFKEQVSFKVLVFDPGIFDSLHYCALCSQSSSLRFLVLWLLEIGPWTCDANFALPNRMIWMIAWSRRSGV